MPLKTDREYREMPLLISDNETIITEFDENGERVEPVLNPLSSFRVDGYATTWEQYLLFDYDNEKVYERFSADCFRDTDMSDVILQYDHSGRVYARQSNGSLVLRVDDHGLAISADLSRTESAKQLFHEIKAEMITKMSWGFIPGDYHVERDGEDLVLVHDSVKKIFDVSAVSIPANPGTEINARSKAVGDMVNAIEEFKRAEAETRAKELETEKKRKQIELKLKLANI